MILCATHLFVGTAKGSVGEKGRLIKKDDLILGDRTELVSSIPRKGIITFKMY